MDRFDTVIVGAGHNGLTCAAYLARSGQRVLVLEASAQVGGLAAGREFHPGFHGSVAHTEYQFAPAIARDLDLASHGYRGDTPPLDTIGLAPGQAPVTISPDSVSGVGEADRASYRRYRASLERFAKALAPFWMKTMPALGSRRPGELLTFARLGLRLRRLGREDMLEFFRVATLPMRDLMDEYFESDVLKAALAWDGLVGGRRVLVPDQKNKLAAEPW